MYLIRSIDVIRRRAANQGREGAGVGERGEGGKGVGVEESRTAKRGLTGSAVKR